jgi:hypothetical protein
LFENHGKEKVNPPQADMKSDYYFYTVKELREFLTNGKINQ